MPDKKAFQTALNLIENDPSKILGLTIGGQKVTPGLEIRKADAQSPPEISYNVTRGTYLVIALDIDAPFPSWDKLGPVLHWIQPGFQPSTAVDGVSKLASSTPFIANYIGPAPPPPSAPHRYVFMLYEQPEGLDVKLFAPAGGKKMGSVARMWTDLAEWEKKLNLGPVIACNYFKSN